MSSYTGAVRFGINYPVIITETPYSLPAYVYNVVFSNVATNSVINMPPVANVPPGWTVVFSNITTNLVSLNAAGSDLFNNGSIATSSYSISGSLATSLQGLRLISSPTTNGNYWVVV